MRTIVVGGGPVGLFCGMTIARKGHDVVLVERDGPPAADGSWHRRGVMQYLLPHFFRHIVRHYLLEDLPDVWEALVGGGAVPVVPEGFPEELTGLQARRSTFEGAWWSVAGREPRMSVVSGQAQSILSRGDRIGGVVVDGEVIEADVVIVATGRTAHLGDELRALGDGGSCGFSYASRMYRARDGVEPPKSALPMGVLHDGYQTIVFPQDDRTLSALFVLLQKTADFSALRHVEAFEAAARVVPNLQPWTDPDRFDAITPVTAGSGLSNTYRGNLDDQGEAAVAGLFFVGDAICTTNPASGRSVSLGMTQAAELLRLIGNGDTDYRGAAEAFDAWAREHVKPWYEDHVYWDATLLARFRGEDIDIDAPLSSDVICAAAQQDPSLFPVVGPFLGMLISPSELRSVEERARNVLRTGWRPPFGDGPCAAELAEVIQQAHAVPAQ